MLVPNHPEGPRPLYANEPWNAQIRLKPLNACAKPRAQMFQMPKYGLGLGMLVPDQGCFFFRSNDDVMFEWSYLHDQFE